MSVLNALSLCIQTQTPVLVWGDPGIGKTSYLEQYSKKTGVVLETLIGSVMEPSDVTGFPVVAQGDENLSARVEQAPPTWALNLAKAENGILFLDELSCSPPAVQAAMLRVVFSLMVGDVSIKNTSVVAAANPIDVAASGWVLAPPMANRFTHLDWHVNVTKWVEGIMDGFGSEDPVELPSDWEETHLQQAKDLIGAYIRSNPEKLFAMPKDEESRGKAWASPRTWEMVARLIGACAAAKTTDGVRNQLVVGTVGDGNGVEFMSWLKEMRLPDPEEVLGQGSDFLVPRRDDKLFVILQSVVRYTMENCNERNWTACWEVLGAAAHARREDTATPHAMKLGKYKIKNHIPWATNKAILKFKEAFEAAKIYNDVKRGK